MDFGQVGQLAKVFRQPFLYAGDYSRFRDRRHGAPLPSDLTGDRFVVCIQNHDQVGNRARGDRLSTLLDHPARQRLAASFLLLSPYLPLLFMGEEYGEENPFPFFCSFGDAQLIKAVREGRQKEFADFAWQGEVPDPHDEATFLAARLSWSWPEGTPRAGLRRLYADLLAARREWPALRNFTARSARLWPDETTGTVLELVRGADASQPGRTVQVFMNLAAESQPLPLPESTTTLRLLFSSESASYSGGRQGSGPIANLLPFECVVLGPEMWKAFP
jgi:maltooligosyltrehalose trehalohydrolase